MISFKAEMQHIERKQAVQEIAREFQRISKDTQRQVQRLDSLYSRFKREINQKRRN